MWYDFFSSPSTICTTSRLVQVVLPRYSQIWAIPDPVAFVALVAASWWQARNVIAQANTLGHVVHHVLQLHKLELSPCSVFIGRLSTFCHNFCQRSSVFFLLVFVPDPRTRHSFRASSLSHCASPIPSRVHLLVSLTRLHAYLAKVSPFSSSSESNKMITKRWQGILL